MVSRIKHVSAIAKREIEQDIVIAKEFSVPLALNNLSSRFIFQGSNTVWGKKLNRKKYDYVEQWCKHEFADLIIKYKDKSFLENEKISPNSNIWICWWQGLNNAPYAVKACVQSVKEKVGGERIIIIDKENYHKYAYIPSYIIEKLEQGLITLTHFSDILRLALLEKNGGFWIDATLLFTGNIPKDIYNYQFYTIKHGKYSDFHVCRGMWSGFFMASIPGNPLISFCLEILFEYWKKQNHLIAYLLIDVTLCLAYDNISWAKSMIDRVPLNNTAIFNLQENMNCPYSAKQFNLWCEKTFLHKISYKIPFKSNRKENTYWDYIMKLPVD